MWNQIRSIKWSQIKIIISTVNHLVNDPNMICITRRGMNRPGIRYLGPRIRLATLAHLETTRMTLTILKDFNRMKATVGGLTLSIIHLEPNSPGASLQVATKLQREIRFRLLKKAHLSRQLKESRIGLSSIINLLMRRIWDFHKMIDLDKDWVSNKVDLQSLEIIWDRPLNL